LYTVAKAIKKNTFMNTISGTLCPLFLLDTLLAVNTGGKSYEQLAKLPTISTKPSTVPSLPFTWYPRHQLQHSDWLCLDGKWDYLSRASATSSPNPSKPINFDFTIEQRPPHWQCVWLMQLKLYTYHKQTL
jgi:hypothetical protein